MFVNPFPFGIFIGVVGTILTEILALVIYAFSSKGDKKK